MRDMGVGKHLLALQLCTLVTYLGSRVCLRHQHVQTNTSILVWHVTPNSNN